MKKYVALLRGINIGGRIIKRADLKACFEDAGFSDVATLIQSGNVLFDSETKDSGSVRQKAEAAVSKRFGYDARIFIYEPSKLKRIAENYPFDAGQEDFQHYAIFLEGIKNKELVNVAPKLDPKLEAIASGDTVVYWKVKKGLTLRSPFSKLLTKAEFKAHTNRNIKTVKKLVNLSE